MSRYIYKKSSTTELILLAQQGDIKALEELIRKKQKQVYAIFAHLTKKKNEIADLTQEALIKMARALPSLKDAEKFKPWFDQIITNVFYDHARKNSQNYIEITESEFQEIKDKIGCEPGEKCLFSEIEQLIKTALLTLPKELRLTIVLREFEGLSYNDIAKITNSAIGTVKSRISRARLKLQEELKDYI